MALEIVGDILRGIIVTGSVLAGILAILIWIRNKTERLSALRFFIQIAAVPVIFLGLIIGPIGPQFQPLGNAPRAMLV
jgi:prolipoprotein diacylglyceryltransferase